MGRQWFVSQSVLLKKVTHSLLVRTLQYCLALLVSLTPAPISFFLPPSLSLFCTARSSPIFGTAKPPNKNSRCWRIVKRARGSCPFIPRPMARANGWRRELAADGRERSRIRVGFANLLYETLRTLLCCRIVLPVDHLQERSESQGGREEDNTQASARRVATGCRRVATGYHGL